MAEMLQVAFEELPVVADSPAGRSTANEKGGYS